MSRAGRLLVLFKSKAVWGAIFAAAAWLASQPHVGLADVVQALGTVLSAAGVRDAITKATAPDGAS